MKTSKQHGFTIVELLIVIVVIAILAAISIVAYNGIQQRAKNTATASAASAAIKLLKLYKVDNGEYPSTINAAPPHHIACIGTGYQNNICHTNADGVTANAITLQSFNDALETVGTLPEPPTDYADMSGRNSAGVYFRSTDSMFMYTLRGQNQSCDAGGTGYNYSATTQCRLILP